MKAWNELLSSSQTRGIVFANESRWIRAALNRARESNAAALVLLGSSKPGCRGRFIGDDEIEDELMLELPAALDPEPLIVGLEVTICVATNHGVNAFASKIAAPVEYTVGSPLHVRFTVPRELVQEEIRKASRLPVRDQSRIAVEVVMDNPETTVPSRAVDLGVGGMQFEVEGQADYGIEVGQTCSVTVNYRTRKTEHRAVVRWTRGKAVGVEFLTAKKQPA